MSNQQGEHLPCLRHPARHRDGVDHAPPPFRDTAEFPERLAAEFPEPSQTASEHLLFLALRGKRLGVSFKRQVPLLGRFIVDLYASKARLVVEVDGSAHDARARQDAARDRALRQSGYRVLRVSADLVLRDADAAAELVRAALRVAEP